MRQALVFYKKEFAGIIRESDEGFIFQYDSDYLANVQSKPVSLTLPLQQKAISRKILFPFFDGLIPEGWLLNIAVTNWKIICYVIELFTVCLPKIIYQKFLFQNPPDRGLSVE